MGGSDYHYRCLYEHARLYLKGCFPKYVAYKLVLITELIGVEGT